MLMETLLIKALFGHLIGDFFLQSGTMAGMKNAPGRKGSLWCSIHVAIYTSVVVLFVREMSPIFILGVFLPHWIVDRFSLAYRWMNLLGRGRLIDSPVPKEASFGAIIYVTMDQTVHMGCLYLLLTFVV